MSGRLEGSATKAAAIVAMMAWWTLVSGCGDDTGDTHTGTIGDPASGSPELTWDSMARSLNNQRATGWINALADSFEYVPDPVADAEYPGALSSWGRADEVAFVQAALSADLEITASFNALDVPCPASSGSVFVWPSVEYSVVVAGAAGANPVTYRGVAELEFELQGSFWYLSRWTDLRGAPAPWNGDIMCPTLGELRAVYRGE
jgi:hypothetical protein